MYFKCINSYPKNLGNTNFYMNALDYIRDEHKYSIDELYQIFGEEANSLLNSLKSKHLIDTNDQYEEKEMMDIIDNFFTDYNLYRKKKRSWIKFI